MTLFYISANPFIYAVKFDPVKRVLLRLILCVRAPVRPDAGEMSGTGTGTGRPMARSVQERN